MNKNLKETAQRHRPCKELRLQYHDEAIRLYYEEQLGGISIGKKLGSSDISSDGVAIE